MAGTERSRNLTQTELAAVLRRAAELDAERDLPVPAHGLDPAVVEAAAVEAGLSPEAVRRAITEVMHPDEAPPDLYTEGMLPARQLVLSREVAGPVEAIDDEIARFMRRQLFDRRRIFADGARWAPRRGWAANVRRGADPSGRFVLKQVRCIDVTIVPLDDDGDTVLVRVCLDLSQIRSIHTGWLATGVGTGGLVIAGTGLTVGIDPLALLSLPAAGGLTAGGHLVGRWNATREAEKVHTAVAGMLDRLEHDRQLGRAGRSRSSSKRRTGPPPDTIEPMDEEQE